MLSLSFIKEIEKIIGRENVLTGEADRQNYAYDAAVLPPVVPGLVVRPTLMLEDATVPRSKIPAMLEALDKIAARHHVTIGTFGHAGDGNLHPSILCDKRDKEEFSRVERAVDDLFNVALELGGTLSGEHGIGTSKKKWLELETSKGTLEYMRRMRSAFDPKKLLNASKIVSL